MELMSDLENLSVVHVHVPIGSGVTDGRKWLKILKHEFETYDQAAGFLSGVLAHEPTIESYVLVTAPHGEFLGWHRDRVGKVVIGGARH